MSKGILVSGGTGFIGSHVCDYILTNTDWTIYIIDRLDSTSSLERIRHLLPDYQTRIKFIYHNLCSKIPHLIWKQLFEKIHYVIHLGASTHVDRSISDPLSFIEDNVIGTHNLLWLCQELGGQLEKVIYFSTDEVFGSAGSGENYKEWDRYKSGNPYAATKAGAEELALAYHNTYKIPVLITHTMNVFGERQHSEKFIPLCIKSILNGTEVAVHADKECKNPGSRFYIHANDVASALLFLLNHGNIGDKYNIVGEKEVNNLDILKLIGQYIGKYPLYKLVDFHSSRPGHDLRYALDGSKMKEMGFVHNHTIESALQRVVKWYCNNLDWL